jgi:murein DD-endopeptidase MepM/ murein hydrolase activator NlpD
MKLKLGKRSLTFMIIPDAGRRVMRFRVSSYLLYLVPMLLLTTALVILFLQYHNLKSTSEKNRLAYELAMKTSIYERTIINKDLTIHQLEDQIQDISTQTETIQQRIEELRLLEEEIRDVTAPGDSNAQTTAARSGKVTISSANLASDEALGVGGSQIDAHQHNYADFFVDTKRDLSDLQIEADDLITSITNAKMDLIAHMDKLRITPSIWPTLSSEVSSTYGYRKDPFTRRSAFHAGVDIAGKRGDPIFVTADGIVTYAGYKSAYGYHVVVRHDSGVSTRYAHMLKNLSVETGQKVNQGDQVGELGSTGRSTGPHLHYEIIKNGSTIDPMPYMKVEER